MAKRKPERSPVDVLHAYGWPGGVALEDPMAHRLRDAWRARYGAALTARSAFEWDAFVPEVLPFLEREAAIEAYAREEQSEPVIVLSAERAQPLRGALFASTPRPVTLPASRTHPDLIVFPESLAWTFAVTHEWGWCGPYFAKKP